MEQKKRRTAPQQVLPETGAEEAAAVAVAVAEEVEDAEKRLLYSKPRLLAVLLALLILLCFSLLALARADLVHLALFHHTADYHANNHVTEKILEHKEKERDRERDGGGNSERQRDRERVKARDSVIDTFHADHPLSVLAVDAHNQKVQNSVKKQQQRPAVLLDFKEEDYVRTEVAKSQTQSQSQTEKKSLNLRSVKSQMDHNGEDLTKTLSTSTEQVSLLKEEAEKQIAVVRHMKYDEHIVMETDARARTEIVKLQQLVRQYLRKAYGDEPIYLDMTLEFPPAMDTENGQKQTHHLIIQLGSIDLVPYSVYYFLDLVANWKGGAFHRKAGHVLQAMLTGHGARSEGLAFQEYNPEFPHVKHSMGYAGRPGGPGFYISTVDNSYNHGPGSQGSKTEADSCFGRIVKGIEVVEKMKKQPGAGGGNGFINDSKNFIRIPSVKVTKSPFS